MATEADLHAWTAASGRDWNQMCQAYISNLCAAFGNLTYYPSSAISAYYSSHIESYDAFTAPPGAIIWFDIGTYGHVQVRVDSGNAHGSSRLQAVWGINAGVADLGWYIAQTGATPLGWSWDSAGSHINYSPEGAGFLMALSDQQQADMYSWLHDVVYGWLPDLTASATSTGNRLAASDGNGNYYGYDWLPAIANQNNDTTAALARVEAAIAELASALKAAGLDVDTEALEQSVTAQSALTQPRADDTTPEPDADDDDTQRRR